MLGDNKLVVGEMLARIKQLYKTVLIVLFCSVGFLRICVCLNRIKPWLELSNKFKNYSMRFFQKALVEFGYL